MSVANPSFKQLLFYEKNSFAFEPGLAGGQIGGGEWGGVIFRVGDIHLTCNIEQVSEFLPVPVFTPVPGTKPWILGLSNVRGDLLTVIDLSWFLNGVRTSVSMRTRLLATSLRGRPVGLLVDEVFGHRQFVKNEGKKSHLPKGTPIRDYVHQQYRSGKDVWQELDLETLFSTAEFLNGAAA
jgi:twitching motility protein PilI